MPLAVCVIAFGAICAACGSDTKQTGVGFIDDSMTGFAEALGAAFDGAAHMERHFKKLKKARGDERHLFIPLHRTALPFSIFSVLQFDEPLPPEPPPVPDHITHLWLAPECSRRVLIWGRSDGWRNFFPYD